jgi:hypothetical protein
MSWNGRVNVDALIHDEAANAIKVLDVESSLTVGTKAVVVNGTATELGTSISPDDEHEIGYTDSSGNVVTFSSVSLLVIKGTNALDIVVNNGIMFHAAAGQCAMTATPGMTNESIIISGTGTFSLLIVGE